MSSQSNRYIQYILSVYIFPTRHMYSQEPTRSNIPKALDRLLLLILLLSLLRFPRGLRKASLRASLSNSTTRPSRYICLFQVE